MLIKTVCIIRMVVGNALNLAISPRICPFCINLVWHISQTSRIVDSSQIHFFLQVSPQPHLLLHIEHIDPPEFG